MKKDSKSHFMHPVMTLIINKITQHISNLGHYCNDLTLLLG